jgi:3-hydroxyisobutyrate dehydrogenase-like beta-hydroxyacid dehydrogenase
VNVALIGLGEVGRALSEELAGGHSLSAWDIAFADPDSRAARNVADLNAAGVTVRAAIEVADAVGAADVVISAVTAANDYAAAEDVAAAIAPNAWFVDLNSASPGQKQRAASLIDDSGGRYVEAAVLSPINPKRLAAPILLGGPHAERFADVAAALGFTGAEFYTAVVGPASATKLCRSVIIKGLEALMAESMLTARVWGVETQVLDSLSNLLPPADWHAIATYLISRSLEHGGRRSQEMYEAAATVAETGVEPLMATATAKRQAWAGEQAAALEAGDLEGILDAIRKATT